MYEYKSRDDADKLSDTPYVFRLPVGMRSELARMGRGKAEFVRRAIATALETRDAQASK